MLLDSSLLKMACLGEHGRKDTTQSILHDFIRGTRILFGFRHTAVTLSNPRRRLLPRAHYIILRAYHTCSSNKRPETSGSVQKKTFLLDTCCILNVYVTFSKYDLYPRAVNFVRCNLNWKTKLQYIYQIEYHIQA